MSHGQQSSFDSSALVSNRVKLPLSAKNARSTKNRSAARRKCRGPIGRPHVR